VDEREYTLVEHLAELRQRLGRALIGVVLLAVAAFAVSEQLLELLRAPMQQMLTEVHGPSARFMVTGAAEYIIAQMKVALVAGLFLASPWVLYQVWLFVAPGLYDHERRYAIIFVWAGAFFFVGGAAFCYLAVFPTMFRFLVESLPPDIAMMPSLDEHFSFTLKMLLAFGVVFETPVFIFVLSLAGIIDPNKLGVYRRYVIVIAFIVGAILTPTPDFLTQFMLAGPLIVLYEVGVFVSRLAIQIGGRPLDRKAARAGADTKAAGH
jgi:sec-independent protein translocase protein TatC